MLLLFTQFIFGSYGTQDHILKFLEDYLATSPRSREIKMVSNRRHIHFVRNLWEPVWNVHVLFPYIHYVYVYMSMYMILIHIYI